MDLKNMFITPHIKTLDRLLFKELNINFITPKGIPDNCYQLQRINKEGKKEILPYVMFVLLTDTGILSLNFFLVVTKITEKENIKTAKVENTPLMELSLTQANRGDSMEYELEYLVKTQLKLLFINN